MECRLKDLAQKITKGTTPSNIGEGFSDSGVMYFRSELIGKTKYIDRSAGLLYISEAVHDRLKRSQIEKNDILFSMAGIYLGKVSLVGDDDYPANTNQAVAIIRLKENACSHDYLYYYMTQKWFNVYVNLRTAQAAQPNINLEQIGKLKINLPNQKVQDEIASILSAYDDLIENNNKRIKILEQMAENLYKEWFVRFRFPGYEQAECENGIPKGWEYKTIEELSDTLRRGISPTYDSDGKYTVINQKCIRSSILDMSEAQQQSKPYKSELNLQDGDTVICSTGTGTLGRVGQVYGEYKDTTYDSHVTLVRANQVVGRHFLYWSLKELQPWFMNMGIGSTNQQELYRGTIKNAKILVPSNVDLLDAFENYVQDIHCQIGLLRDKNQNLTKQRDKLLPRLMSGKLEV